MYSHDRYWSVAFFPLILSLSRYVIKVMLGNAHKMNWKVYHRFYFLEESV